MTGFYTVLVEGDDMNEPIADAVRSLLDGHIVLSRELAHRNHYPAIDVLESVSRLQQSVAGEEQLARAGRLREALAEYRQSEDLVRLGAYAAGSNSKLDAAIKSRDDMLDFLRQDPEGGAADREDARRAGVRGREARMRRFRFGPEALLAMRQRKLGKLEAEVEALQRKRIETLETAAALDRGGARRRESRSAGDRRCAVRTCGSSMRLREPCWSRRRPLVSRARRLKLELMEGKRAVLEARREVEALEKLRERSLKAWRRKAEREEEALASEIYLAR